MTHTNPFYDICKPIVMEIVHLAQVVQNNHGAIARRLSAHQRLSNAQDMENVATKLMELQCIWTQHLPSSWGRDAWDMSVSADGKILRWHPKKGTPYNGFRFSSNLHSVIYICGYMAGIADTCSQHISEKHQDRFKQLNIISETPFLFFIQSAHHTASMLTNIGTSPTDAYAQILTKGSLQRAASSYEPSVKQQRQANSEEELLALCFENGVKKANTDMFRDAPAWSGSYSVYQSIQKHPGFKKLIKSNLEKMPVPNKIQHCPDFFAQEKRLLDLRDALPHLSPPAKLHDFMVSDFDKHYICKAWDANSAMIAAFIQMIFTQNKPILPPSTWTVREIGPTSAQTIGEKMESVA